MGLELTRGIAQNTFYTNLSAIGASDGFVSQVTPSRRHYDRLESLLSARQHFVQLLAASSCPLTTPYDYCFVPVQFLAPKQPGVTYHGRPHPPLPSTLRETCCQVGELTKALTQLSYLKALTRSMIVTT